MNSVKEYKDIVAYHPGYYIADIIEDMGISQAEFAIRMGTTAKTLSQLIHAQANISNDLAKKLSAMTGTSIELWQNLQNTYDKKRIEIEQAKDIDAQKDVIKEIDYKYFVEVVGLPKVKSIIDQIANLCCFLKVSDLRIMLQPDFLVNFRTASPRNSKKNIMNSRAWIQTAINISKNIDTKPYDAEKLKGYLPELRSMTVRKPEEFLPRMREIFSECGVAFVLLPHLKNSGVNGAVKWVNEDRVVLAMNNRGLDADKFWFSLFHELAHIVLGHVGQTNGTSEDDEKEADRWSGDTLIDSKDFEDFRRNGDYSESQVLQFAKAQGIAPGIIVGRMQLEGMIKYSMLNKLKEKYEIVI